MFCSHYDYDRQYNKRKQKERQRNTTSSEPTIQTFRKKATIIMPVEYSTTVRVAYCVQIEAPEDCRIDWIKTQERLERFVESYGNNEDGEEGERSAKRVCTVSPSNSLFALAAQAVTTTDNDDLQAALPNETKEDLERIRQIYPILLPANYKSEDDEEEELGEEENFEKFKQHVDRFVATTSKALGKILGRDDHGLRFSCIAISHYELGLVAKLVLLSHGIKFEDSWGGMDCAAEVSVVPLSVPSVEPAVGVSMIHVLSVLGMKAVDEPGWKVIGEHCHEHY
jgi:uncharacterized protein YkuJ